MSHTMDGNKVTLIFEITDFVAFREAYKEALTTSGYDPETQQEKLATFFDRPESLRAALVECMSHASFDMSNCGVEWI